MVSGGMTCIKYLLFCFNLLFAISGIAILTVGAVVHISYAQYSNFVYEGYQSIPFALIIVGIIISVVAFFGCCGAVRESNCMIITFSVLLGIIFALEIAAGVVGYVRRSEVETMLKNKLNSTMYNYYQNDDVKESWDIAQHELKCCGMNGPKDWSKVTHDNTLPHTCCPDTADDGSCTIDVPNKYEDSCIVKLKDMFIKYASVIGGVGIGIAAFQVLGIIFACTLARHIRLQYETV